jgi:hypothetical protein
VSMASDYSHLAGLDQLSPMNRLGESKRERVSQDDASRRKKKKKEEEAAGEAREEAGEDLKEDGNEERKSGKIVDIVV